MCLEKSACAVLLPSGCIQQPQLERRRIERAERAKLRGNECFKAGRFSDAIKAYSEALKLDPGNPVYANNRAMAYLKVFRCEQRLGTTHAPVSLAGACGPGLLCCMH